MTIVTRLLIAALIFLTGYALAERPTMSDVLAAASDDDWRRPLAENTLYLKLPTGMVVMEVAPQFAPNVIDNLRVMTSADYFADTAIIRSQENYVVQWADPNAESDNAMSLGKAAPTVPAEFYRNGSDLDMDLLDSRDAYADVVGFVDGFPAGRDIDKSRAWLLHCYGMLGVGRANDADSGSGAELYVVTGHAPRHLDRNVVLIGRVLQGMELLTTLQRGTGDLSFYQSASEYTPIEYMRFGDGVPEADRVDLEVLRTDTGTFQQLVESRRYRSDPWFVDPAGNIGVCNVPLPVRQVE
jgi:peptidylprolyl isomerase